jgi:hypothetical protein
MQTTIANPFQFQTDNYFRVEAIQLARAEAKKYSDYPPSSGFMEDVVRYLDLAFYEPSRVISDNNGGAAAEKFTAAEFASWAVSCAVSNQHRD